MVKPKEVEEVLSRFEATWCNEVHQEIREFIQEMGILKAVVGKDIVFENIMNLIDHYRAKGEDNAGDTSIITFFQSCRSLTTEA